MDKDRTDPSKMNQQKNGSSKEDENRQRAAVLRLENELAVTRATLQDKIDQLQNLNAELKAAEERTRHLASFPQVNPNPVLEVASPGRVTYSNPATQTLLADLGMDPGDIAAFLPADMDAILQDLANKKDASLYREIPVGDRIFGATVHLVSRFNVVRIYAFDITERQRAGEALRQSEQRLKRAQEIAHLGSWELDLTNNVLTWSDEVYRIFGLKPQEFAATYEAFLESVHPDDRAAVNEAYSRSVSEGRNTYEIEHRVVRKATGEIRIVHEKCEHFRDESGRITRSVGMVHDITERRGYEDALLQAKLEWERTFDSVPDLIAILDKEYRFVRVNRAMAVKLGVTPEQCIGQQCFACVHGTAAPPGFCPHTRTITDGKQHVAEVYEKRLDAYFLVTTTPLFAEDGTISGTVHVARDITERKQAEEEVKKLNENLNNSVIQLEAANRELEAFSYSVSHDLRSPLRSIAGFSHALQEDYEDRLDAEGRDCLDRIVANTQRMGQLIDDLLKLSRVTRTEMQQERVDLSGLAARIATRLKRGQPERRVECIVQADIFANGDENLLRVVLENLLDNAFKFTAKEPNAVIEFGVTERDSDQVFFVQDNGAGFDMAYCAKLFQPFQRLHSLHEFSGTGIGLATVRRIINRHGGRVWIEGEPGKGAVVSFTIPEWTKKQTGEHNA
jgi:PAS domain S-box-containing protein